MTINLSAACKGARSYAVRDTIDAGTESGRIQLYSGTRPAAGGIPPEQVIVEIELTKPSGTVDEAGLHLTQAVIGQVIRAGTITWGRVVDGNGDWVIDGDAGTSGAVDFLLDVATVYPGSFVSLLASTLAEGG